MLVRCQLFGDLFLFGLVWQYSLIQKNIMKVGSKPRLLTSFSNITLSLPSLYFSESKRELNFCNGYLSLLYFCLGPSRGYRLGVWCRNLFYTTFRSFLAEGIAIEWQAKAKIRKVENAFIVTVQMSSTIWLSFEHCAITLLLQDYDLNNINR